LSVWGKNARIGRKTRIRVHLLLVFPIAIRDIADIRIGNLKDWMRYPHIPLGILANFYATWVGPMILRV
jgi:hypothetical protein